MKKISRCLVPLIFVACLVWAGPSWGFGWTQNTQPGQLKGVGVTEHRGSTVSIHDFHFLDEQGKQVTLSDYFKKDRPVVLALVYYKCPNLCNLLLGGLVDSFKRFNWTVGNQFQFVAVSINPKETPQDAAHEKKKYLDMYNRPESASGWHFLTSPDNQVKKLARQLGFKYHYDVATKQYAHAAVTMILTPKGKISKYLYGISFHSKDMKFALIDASGGKVGSVVDQVILCCFHFDPSRNSYTLRMWRVVQIVLTMQLLALVGLMWILWRKDRDRPGKRPASSSS